MNPDTPPVRQKLETWQKVAIGGAAAIFAGFLVLAYFNNRQATAAHNTAAPATRAATRPAAPITELPPTISASSPNSTCADSATWEQQGGTELIDGYINNQDTGNVKVDEIKSGCPKYLTIWQKAQGGISSGTSAVPADAKPGTYETTSSMISDCYWERSRGGHIVDNNFVTASTVKQRVTIRATDDTFVSQGCGNWVKVG